jgi:hypothetical protein
MHPSIIANRAMKSDLKLQLQNDLKQQFSARRSHLFSLTKEYRHGYW